MTVKGVSRVAAVSLATSLIFARAAAGQVAGAVYLDPARPLDQRVDDLVGRMALEEKASQMVNHTRAIPRLGVPEYNLWSEALHGVANSGIATVFPQAIGLGATFDAPLLHQMAEVIAVEARVKFNAAQRSNRTGRLFQGLTFFSPNINIVRDDKDRKYALKVESTSGFFARLVWRPASPGALDRAVDAAGNRLVGAGKYGLMIGGGQPGTSAVVSAAEFEIRGDKRLPR